MLKNSILCLILSGFALAGDTPQVQVNLKDILSNPTEYLNKVVVTTGTVEHVCKHGGKKMLIFADTPEQSLHVMGSDKVPVFDAEVNGSNVRVVGVLKENRITKAQVLKLIDEQQKAELKGNTKPSVSKGEGPGHGEANPAKHEEKVSCGDHPLLKQMEASGKDYVSEYFVECMEYKTVK